MLQKQKKTQILKSVFALASSKHENNRKQNLRLFCCLRAASRQQQAKTCRLREVRLRLPENWLTSQQMTSQQASKQASK